MHTSYDWYSGVPHGEEDAALVYDISFHSQMDVSGDHFARLVKKIAAHGREWLQWRESILAPTICVKHVGVLVGCLKL